MLSGQPPLFAIYIHFPWCPRRCGYCDFATVQLADFPHQAYADAVIRELSARKADFSDLTLGAVYFGGGTPSLWPSRYVAQVLDAIFQLFPTVPQMSITLEANPEEVTLPCLTGLKAAGINRLSLGIQSLDDAALKTLTRTHGAQQGKSAVRLAHQSGFSSVNCDLIFGLPGETVEQHVHQIDQYLSLSPQHLSLYHLTLSKSSSMRRAGIDALGDDFAVELMDAARDHLERAGYAHYEISNYALPGHRSAHNELVWSGDPYLGVGASAHSMVLIPVPMNGPDMDAYGVVRLLNPPFSRYLAEADPLPDIIQGPPHYLNGARVEYLRSDQSRFEAMFVGLRTVAGIDRKRYARRFGADPMVHFENGLNRLASLGHITVTDTHFTATRQTIWAVDELATYL